jgi:multiple sugar transport system substrate-binding protein
MASALVFCLGCGSTEPRTTVIDFWAIGAEGERVGELVRQFERENPTLEVRLQQLSWTGAHEKLVTAFAGDATPDVCQLGNTWIPEFVALGALEALDERVAASQSIERGDYFAGLWETNRVGQTLYGIPWYADTRLLFYRSDLLMEAGYDHPPETWDEWLAAMRAIKRRVGRDRYALLIPTNEWEQPAIFALQTGGQMLRNDGQYGNFESPEFRHALEFYVNLFKEGLAPPLRNTQVSNVWEEFARGYFAMYITGPWNIGEFRRRLPAELQDKWATAVLPRPTSSANSVSQAGGCGLVVFRRSECKDAAWRLIEFLSQPTQQRRFYELTGNLPPRESSWSDGKLMKDPQVVAFHTQLKHAVPFPRVPEWEQITRKIVEAAETVIAGRTTMDAALAEMNRSVNRLLEKRRWMLARQVSRMR